MAKKKTTAEAEPPAASPLLPLSGIIGNARPRRLLAAAVAEGRLLPALLLHGPRGIGKFTTARSLAAAINCSEADGAEACLNCPSCRQIGNWAHPDVKVLESDAESRAAGRPEFFPESPAVARPGGRASARLLVGQVRRLLRETAFKPFAGGRRVMIIRHLESDPSMGCANALLKALEEPPAGTSFILTSSRPDRLPDTIRSRCQSLSFLPPSRQETAAFLQQQGVSPEEATLRAALAGGRPGVALALDAQGGLAQRDGILAALTAAAGGEAVEAMAAADQLLPAAADMPALLDFFALVARDLMVLHWDRDHRLIHNADRIPQLEEIGRHIHEQRAALLLERIGWCQQALERYVNPGMMLQTLLLEAGGHLPAEPLTAPWLGNEEMEA